MGLHIVYDITFVGLSGPAAAAVELAAERNDLEARRAALNAATERSINDLQAADFSVRDIAGWLAITPGRVSQIGQLARTA